VRATYLNIQWCFPRLENVLGGELGQLRHVLANVVAIRISLLAEGNGRVATEVLIEPVGALSASDDSNHKNTKTSLSFVKMGISLAANVGIRNHTDSHCQLALFSAQSESSKYKSNTLTPASQLCHKSPRVKKHATACRANCNQEIKIFECNAQSICCKTIAKTCSSSYMMNPSLQTQLCHDCVNEWKAGFCILERVNQLRIVRPRNLSTTRISHHLAEIRSGCRSQIEKLAPQQLTMERNWWLRVLAFETGVNCVDFVVES
jgi:hypothetical protein